MSDKPETLADIVAQMRRWAKEGVTLVGAGYIADRIEAAAKNTENAFGMALAIEDGLHKRDKQSDPGNAAALREALENVERVARFCAEAPRHTLAYPTDTARADVLYSRIAELGSVARAALAAPARNCDRFATADDARRAFESAHSHGIVHNLYTAAFDWLFDMVEKGGAK